LSVCARISPRKNLRAENLALGAGVAPAAKGAEYWALRLERPRGRHHHYRCFRATSASKIPITACRANGIADFPYVIPATSRRLSRSSAPSSFHSYVGCQGGSGMAGLHGLAVMRQGDEGVKFCPGLHTIRPRPFPLARQISLCRDYIKGMRILPASCTMGNFRDTARAAPISVIRLPEVRDIIEARRRPTPSTSLGGFAGACLASTKVPK